jgi:predicted dehydrogenase
LTSFLFDNIIFAWLLSTFADIVSALSGHLVRGRRQAAFRNFFQRLKMIKIGVIGLGYWGPNLVRTLTVPGRSRVTMACDIDAAAAARLAERHPDLKTTTRVDELLAGAEIDAVAIATPVRSHYELAMAALRAGKHVLVEKPITETSEQARRLIDEAGRRGAVLMVDHTFVYTGAVRRIRDIVRSGDLGQIYYYDSIRVNLGLFQRDVNVLWDLAIHDLSILDYVLDARPTAISAVGTKHVAGSPENIAYLSLFLAGGAVAHINVNWLAPVKVRQTLIGGSRKMIVFDDLQPSEKLRIYDKGITVRESPGEIHQLLIGYRTGDMWAPQLPTREALVAEAEHFIDCIETGGAPVTDGAMGLRLLEILEHATLSMSQQGCPVAIDGIAA